MKTIKNITVFILAISTIILLFSCKKSLQTEKTGQSADSLLKKTITFPDNLFHMQKTKFQHRFDQRSMEE